MEPDGGSPGPDGGAPGTGRTDGVPADHAAPAAGAHTAGAANQPAVDFTEVQAAEQFRELRKRHRSFVFPMAVAFLLWYFAYVLLADYAHDFMATPVFGNVNIGILLGLAQFVSTFAITMWYVSYANRRLDPIAANLRHELESAAPEAFSDPTGGKK
ncbi:DUF485 domain-containing protein [Arthrobacter crusticola]|uniref:DUF485 domain-containing protein n=1 Tax=Arthrobacter crusticola TaxID=2547960 RepID=UPI003CCC5D39